MIAYLDNAATTKPYDEVVEIINRTYEQDYGNPSSMHMKGYDAEKYIKSARETISKILKVDAKEIYFTSGGTESNNTALVGSVLANNRRGKHIISTRIEHASVYNPLLFLQEYGYEIDFLNVDSMGHISIEELKNTIRDDTILVSIMHVNNEVGAVQNLEEIGKCIKSVSKEILFHVDAIQSFGKYKIFPRKWNIDLLSVSGHKIHGPNGSGFIYIKDKTKIKPIILGGGQEKGFRSGTENVAAIAGLGEAAKLMYANLNDNIDKMYELKLHLIKELLKIEGVTVNAVDVNNLDNSIRETAPHIVSASFEGIRSEVLLHALEEREIYVSSGSACSSNHPAISGTLKAIGVDNNLLDSTIRFSFSTQTTIPEIDYAVSVVKTLIPTLRKFIRH